MGGGLMQLVAYGAQDVYLTGNPQITFWKVTYRRHTNFAMESIEQTFNGQADFGRRVTCTISRNGDLAYRTYLQVTLPEISQEMRNGQPRAAGSVIGKHDGTGVYARWLDNPGLQLISPVEVEIGGQRIDRHYGDWMNIWNQLTLTSEQERGYNSMIGQTTQLTYITDPAFNDVDGPCDSNAPKQVCAPRNALPETTLYVPLQFWYCRNPGLALPLIALQYHEVKINLDLRPIDECLWAVSALNCEPEAAVDAAVDATGTITRNRVAQRVRGTKVTTAYGQSLVAASLYVDYVFLDTDERRRMAQNPHEYLIEQLQFTGDESVGSSSNKIKLNFNHPCKELIWVVQPDKNVDYCSSFDCEESLFKLLGAQPFNYTDALDALPNAIHAFGSEAGLTGQINDTTYSQNEYINENGLFADAAPLGYQLNTGGETEFSQAALSSLFAATPLITSTLATLGFAAAGAGGQQTDALDIDGGITATNGVAAAEVQLADTERTAAQLAVTNAAAAGRAATPTETARLVEASAKQLFWTEFANELNIFNADKKLTPVAGVVSPGAAATLVDYTAQLTRFASRTLTTLTAPQPAEGGAGFRANPVTGWNGLNINGWGGNAFGRRAGAPDPDGAGDELRRLGAGTSGVSDAGTFVLAECAMPLHCWGQNPVVTAKLQLNGQDRFSEREGGYFDLVQPYQHHTRNPDTGINVYSFALRPEEHQPSGSCNFSRIDNATLQLVLSNAAVAGTGTAKVRVYSTNYNVLRVMSGMGGLAYSN